ncbi:glycosyltransferase [Vibrio hepatarius]|uniref:glycosyltransferase n=1 Tax=Vibrio hepatarius TaxID=171383 RepID=UPI001C0A50E2|nr:glycosyltransferase [Vibrio hepatarius]MBU2896880.1 glycosyltransferase [Vibrio hepatarius]
MVSKGAVVNVVCATYNQSEDLIETITSYNDQSYSNKRLIIIDGRSNDGIHSVIERFCDSIDYFVSENDEGISDAFNKGLESIEPGYVYFLGAGDKFCSSESLSQLLSDVDYQQDFLVCGKVKRVDILTGEVQGINPNFSEFKKRSLLFRMSLPHQGLLTSSLFFHKYGKFSLDCRYAMDYEHLLRAYHSFPNVILKDVMVAEWMSGGVGAGRIREVLNEYDLIKRRNKVASPTLLSLVNVFILSKYYVKKVLNVFKKLSG